MLRLRVLHQPHRLIDERRVLLDPIQDTLELHSVPLPRRLDVVQHPLSWIPERDAFPMSRLRTVISGRLVASDSGVGELVIVRQEPGRACAEPASRPSAPRSGGGAEQRALTAASARVTPNRTVVRRMGSLRLVGRLSKPQCEQEAPCVCNRLRRSKPRPPGPGPFPTVLRDNGAAPRRRTCSQSSKGQPSGWPARASRTVGRGSHPKDRSAAEDPRSGLTAGTDRAW